MKKLLLLAVACVMGLFSINAQETTFSYDFNDGTTTGWKTFQGTGNANSPEWQISPEFQQFKLGQGLVTNTTYYLGKDGSKAIASFAIDMTNEGTQCKPDNYIVTESKYLITETSKLTWDAKVPCRNSTESEHYYLVVSEDNETWTSVFDELCPVGDVREYAFTAEYVGKELYIGFQHLYTGSSTYCNDAVVLDNIVLSSEGGNDGGETPEPTAPATPENLVATATGETTISLTWDAVEEATGYNVYSVTTEVVEDVEVENYTLVGSVTETTYTVEGLTAATNYCYAVKAVKETLESEASDKNCATTDEAEPETPEIPEDPNEAYLIREYFDGFEVGDKIAEKGSAWWTTWSNKPGTAEDGIIAEIDGNKVAHITYGNDQVLLLGGQQNGVYELEFDILVPDGKCGYFNILHDFKGGNSVWAMQAYLQMTDDGSTNNQTIAPGHGTLHAAGNSVADVACVYDEWMHFRLHIDTDLDKAQYYYTAPGEEEVMVWEWVWSQDSFGDETVGRKLDAMNFYPPLTSSEYYLDNFTLKKIGGESAPELNFSAESLEATAKEDDMATVELTLENTGTSIAEYVAWVDYGMGEISETDTPILINYDQDPGEDTKPYALSVEEPTEVEIATMFPATSYGYSAAGTYITHLMYPFLPLAVNNSIGIEEGTPVTFRIYGQGLYGQPGEKLAEKVVLYEDVVKEGDWTLVEFDEPIALTGYNVWASVAFTHAVSTAENPQAPLITDGGTAAPYGDLFRFNSTGTFIKASEAWGGDPGNFHLRMVCFGTPVTGGWAELDKTEGVMPIGAEETISVNLTSIGLEAGETYEAKVIFTTNVAGKETVEIPLTLNVVADDNVEEVLSNAYSIYPNPTSAQVMVEGENINYIAVYNSVGQLVNVVKNSNNVVDMSNYDNGVYYFNIVDNAGQSAVQRVVVAK